MLIRPVTADDHTDVLNLAQQAGFGMTSLPADEQVLADKIQASIDSFHGSGALKGQESFLFVLEDPTTQEVVGTTGIKAHVGLNQPFYSYKLTTITQQSRDLEIFSKHELLNVTNDLTGSSEIGALFLSPSYRRDRLGRLLSLCRFLFIAVHRHFFAEQVIAELRGVHDPAGNAPFYDSIARHFFEMDFAQADYLNATRGNQFINDLMPKYPIYASLLPKVAQDAISQPHPNSVPAKAMLEHQGFRWQGYIDIFDGGPTLQADIEHIKAVQHAQNCEIAAIDDSMDTEKFILTNDRFEGFRCCAGRLKLQEDGRALITQKSADFLQLQPGDLLRYLSLQRGE